MMLKSVNYNFFENYPEFFDPPAVARSKNRLIERYKAIILSNLDIIRGAHVLDIASHDGRWSMAAIKNGATKVTGIEGRQILIEKANKIFNKYRIDKSKYEFHRSNLDIAPISGKFDTAFVLGFLYHTTNHYVILKKIAETGVSHMVIDTLCTKSDDAIIQLVEKDSTDLGNSITGFNEKTIEGIPSMKAFEMMLENLGFRKIWQYDWLNAGIKDWDQMGNYKIERRVTFVVSNES